MSIAVVGPSSFTTCFELIGAHGFHAEDGREAARVIERLIGEERFNLIIIPERFSEETRSIRERLIESGEIKPVFLIIPDLTMATGMRMEELRSIVSQAVGTRVEL
ncbi:V-type ATP synthase subunit F [Candidatus Bathyarchaeota archaeon]|nr:V-type ATP synthase subunit F [Candidatus Bathyarchaeota archaeon]